AGQARGARLGGGCVKRQARLAPLVLGADPLLDPRRVNPAIDALESVILVVMVLVRFLLLATIRADVPAQVDQLAAVMARLPQLGIAVRAQLPVIMNEMITGRAKRQLLQILEQILFFQRALVRLVQGFLRPENYVEEDAGDPEEDREQRGEDLGDDVLA